MRFHERNGGWSGCHEVTNGILARRLPDTRFRCRASARRRSTDSGQGFAVRRLFAETALTFPRLLHNYALSSAIGTFVAYTSDGTRELFLRNGRIAFARTSIDGERLGQMLLANGSVSRRQLDRALDRTRAEGRLLGDTLVAEGVIGRPRLEIALREHVEEIVLPLLTADLMDYEFRAGEEQPRGFLDIGPGISSFLIEGIRRGCTVGRALEMLGGRQAVLQICEETAYVGQDIRLRADEWDALNRLDGRRTVEESASASGDPERSVLLLAGLFAVKLVTNRPRRAP